ncbi:MAG: NAD-dependent epimerase/dehydratase family protein [Rhizomicrobium sp.]
MGPTHQIRRLLVTGAAGFVGGVLCNVLRERGDEVIAHYRSGTVPQRTSSSILMSDLREADALKNAPELDVVFHCAAQRPRSYDDAQAAEQNRAADDTVLAFARERRCDLIYASMATLYGYGKSCPPGSAMKTDAGIYPAEKARTEDLGLEQAAAQSRKFSALRINAPYGPDQRARTVIQTFIDNALSQRNLHFYGTGSREQDFTYGWDIAEAFIAASSGPNGYYLISGGQPISMKSLAEMVCRLTGVPENMVKPSGEPDPQEGLSARFDLSLAYHELHWRPQTHLEQGIKNCIGARGKRN